MKPRWLLVVVCVLAALWLAIQTVQHRNANGRQQSAAANPHRPSNVFMGLRELALQGTRANFGLPPGAKPTQPYAVVMDWGPQENPTTVVAIADGSASVYRSKGAASIGGGQAHQPIRDAALKAVKLADDAQPLMHLTTDYPTAQNGQVNLYAVTDAGVFTATSSEEDLRSKRSPLSNLADAGQEIIRQYQLVQKK